MSTDLSRSRRYVTIASPASASLEVKRSVFYGFVARVDTEQAAREFIAGVRREHRQARHVCTAFVLGPDRDVQRSSDDGEPAGTAGAPILEAITRRQTGEGEALLSDVCVAVVRYFGGIKLGAGGLVQAYSSIVAMTLDAATPLTRSRLRLARLAASYEEAGRLESTLRAERVEVRGVEYGTDSAVLILAVDDADDAWDRLVARVAAATTGRGCLMTAGLDWVDRWPDRDVKRMTS